MKLKNIFLFGAKKFFYSGWYLAFKENAKIYNGMFTPLKRVLEGKSKNPEKVIKELCSRTLYNAENSDTQKLCKITAEKLSSQNKKRDKWLSLLMKAVKDASVRCEEKDRIIIDETNINDYIEWDSNELNEGDIVEIMNPAWYQNGKTIEQGHCCISTN